MQLKGNQNVIVALFPDMFLPSECETSYRECHEPIDWVSPSRARPGPPAWLPAAVSQPNMLAQFGTQNDAAAFLHAAATGNWQRATGCVGGCVVAGAVQLLAGLAWTCLNNVFISGRKEQSRHVCFSSVWCFSGALFVVGCRESGF